MDLEQQIKQLQPRWIDIYVIPGFMMWYAVRSRGMGKIPRRVLFSAGALAALRQYDQYKTALMALTGGNNAASNA